MPDDPITDPKRLLERLDAFGESMKDRRRFGRKSLLWAATIDVRGQRFEGVIVDLSAGGARIKFDAPLAEGDELTVVLKRLDELGAKVVWQRGGEAGLQFMLAPEEVAARLQQLLAVEVPSTTADEAAALAEAALSETEPGRRLRLALYGIVALAALVGGGALLAGGLSGGRVEAPLALTGGASDQHSCSSLLTRVGGATNQIDFSLNVASAAQAKCLDLQHLSSGGNTSGGHMVRATKVQGR